MNSEAKKLQQAVEEQLKALRLANDDKVNAEL